MEENYHLSYSSRTEDSRRTLLDLNVSFENSTQSELKDRMNLWLNAIGSELQVIFKNSPNLE